MKLFNHVHCQVGLIAVSLGLHRPLFPPNYRASNEILTPASLWYSSKSSTFHTNNSPQALSPPNMAYTPKTHLPTATDVQVLARLTRVITTDADYQSGLFRAAATYAWPSGSG